MRQVQSLLCVSCMVLVLGADLADGKGRRHASHAKHPSQAAADIAELRSTYVALLDASQTKDAATMQRVLADEYWQTLSDGTTRSKQERIAQTMSPDSVTQGLTLVSFRGYVYGDGGVASAEVVEKGSARGQPFETHLRSTVAFVREAGAWRIIATHVTPIVTPASRTAPN